MCRILVRSIVLTSITAWKLYDFAKCYAIIDRTPVMSVNVNFSSIPTSDAESDMKTQPLKVTLVMNRQICIVFSQINKKINVFLSYNYPIYFFTTMESSISLIKMPVEFS